MQIFPAIDLSGGQVVRLYQGDYDQMTVYGQDPCAVAREFLDAGCLHVVDLDGARDGTLANFESIAAIARQGGLFIEVGGGIRTEDRIREYLDLGVSRCILGTVAVKDFAFTARMAEKYGEKIAVGVDARDGYVAINSPRKKAWTFAGGCMMPVSGRLFTPTSAGTGQSRARTSLSTGSWRALPVCG